MIEAIDRLPVDAPGGDIEPSADAYDKLEDELGDLLFQVMIHSALAIEAGAFTVSDVAARVHDKLVYRHPHVFGDVAVDTPDDVVRNWEQLKQREQQHASIVDGLPSALPALLYVPKLFRKMKVVGLDPAATSTDVVLDEALDRLRGAARSDVQAALGAVFGALVAWARAADLDSEAALRGWAARLEADVRSLEAWAQGQGSTLTARFDAEPGAVQQQWERIRAH